MRSPKLITGEIYHIYNRGVEGRKIFSEDSDYFRFLHDLFEFNDEDITLNMNYYFASQLQLVHLKPVNSAIKDQFPAIRKKPRKLLVNIFAFCLMPNHFHLMIRQKKDGGISKFMHKLGTGYTNYFNTKFKRKGVLFQGKFKAKLVSTDTHFTYLPHYIHLNPIDLMGIDWRGGKVIDFKKIVEFLDSYRWSSYLDYAGKNNFPSVTQREFLLGNFNGTAGYKKSILEWSGKPDLDKINDVVIETMGAELP